MADTDIDAVRKQKKAEYDKQYRLKRKLLLATASFQRHIHDPVLSSLKMEGISFFPPRYKSLAHRSKKGLKLETCKLIPVTALYAAHFQTIKKILSCLTFWHWSFTFNSNKSPTRCNNFSVYYPDVCLQLNMFRAFSRPSRLSPRYEGKTRGSHCSQ
jgi:hypothetical protein